MCNFGHKHYKGISLTSGRIQLSNRLTSRSTLQAMSVDDLRSSLK